MSKIWLAGVSAIALVTVSAALARAKDISTKQLSITGSTDRKTVQLRSADVGVQLSEADDPSANGAAIHLYSPTDDACVILPSSVDDWQNTGTVWRYRNKLTKASARIGNGQLAVKLKGAILWPSVVNGMQGHVNAQVQFGTGTRYCMRCTGNKRDDRSKFLGRECVATACDPEPPTCAPYFLTTTTATTTSTTTTTM